MKPKEKQKISKRRGLLMKLKEEDFNRLTEIVEYFNCTKISVLESAINHLSEQMKAEKKSQNQGN